MWGNTFPGATPAASHRAFMSRQIFERSSGFPVRVVNTAPALVITRGVLEALQPGTLVVDLASEPGGTDFAAARALGVRAMHALSLPARFAPETAGELVGRTVLQMIREREEGA